MDMSLGFYGSESWEDYLWIWEFRPLCVPGDTDHWWRDRGTEEGQAPGLLAHKHCAATQEEMYSPALYNSCTTSS